MPNSATTIGHAVTRFLRNRTGLNYRHEKDIRHLILCIIFLRLVLPNKSRNLWITPSLLTFKWIYGNEKVHEGMSVGEVFKEHVPRMRVE